MTYLCVAIFVHDLAQAKRDIAKAAEAGADLVELRIDHFTDATLVRQLVTDSILPFILTCRSKEEGGDSDLSDQDRINLLFESATGNVRYIDIELQTARRRSTVGSPRQLILSSHDFTGRPTKLHSILVQMNETSYGSINKIVWMPRSIRDNLEAFELLQQRQKPTIALCMGEAGLISRILAKKFGGFLTFAGLTTQSVTAPGQVSIHDMKRLYRWDAIQPSTKVYGVVADPVMHSMSPAIHNAGFDAVNHDGVYLPFLVNPGYESFKAFMESFIHFPALDLSGLSITLPHKENALRYLKEKNANIEPLADQIGALNTIIIDRQNGTPMLQGINTDYEAIVDTILDALKIKPFDLRDKRVAVIGAGGAGRAATAALARLGATVVVYNRTLERAQRLANEMNNIQYADGITSKVVSAPLEKLCDSCCQIFINTTSVGMHPNTDASPLGNDPPKFTKDTLVFDTIYNPPKTKLLHQAEQAGAQTVGGIEMFIRQAARQFQAWTQQPAPLDIFRQVVENRLRAT